MSLGSPGWLLAAATGQSYGTVELVTRQMIAGQEREVLRWTLEDVTVASDLTRIDAATAAETITLRFNKITVTRTVRGDDGAVVRTIVSSFDRRNNQTVNGGLDDSTSTPDVEHELALGATKIDVTAYGWSASRAPGGQAAAGEFTVVLPAVNASPGLLAAVTTRTVFPQFTITSHRADGREYLCWLLTDAVITAFTTLDQAGDDAGPFDLLTVSFREIEQQFMALAPNGDVLATRTVGYDFAANVFRRLFHGSVPWIDRASPDRKWCEERISRNVCSLRAG